MTARLLARSPQGRNFRNDFYNRCKRFGGLMVSEVKHQRQLEEEKAEQKHIVADLPLDKPMLQDVLQKSSVCELAAPGELTDAIRINNL